jgi:hypothetical protein
MMNIFNKALTFINLRTTKTKHDICLFDGDDELFKEILADTDVYAEYGVGLSTTWVLNNTNADVITTDTSTEWIDKIKQSNQANLERLITYQVDVGVLKEWGRPTSYAKRENFVNYTDSVWRAHENIETVLIDGRFRVCCFLTSLKFAKQGTKIIFDDYINREHYHIIENYIQRDREYGRQCLFIVPEKDQLDMDAIDKDIDNFRHVFD